jgi:hypothetical protein
VNKTRQISLLSAQLTLLSTNGIVQQFADLVRECLGSLPGSDAMQQKEYENDDQDRAEATHAAVAIAIAVAPHPSAESAYQEYDEDDYQDQAERHDRRFLPIPALQDRQHIAALRAVQGNEAKRQRMLRQIVAAIRINPAVQKRGCFSSL